MLMQAQARIFCIDPMLMQAVPIATLLDVEKLPHLPPINQAHLTHDFMNFHRFRNNFYPGATNNALLGWTAMIANPAIRKVFCIGEGEGVTLSVYDIFTPAMHLLMTDLRAQEQVPITPRRLNIITDFRTWHESRQRHGPGVPSSQ